MHDIVHELTIAAPPERVYAAVTEAEAIAAWWSPQVELDGGEVRIGQPGGGPIVLRVDAFEPPELAHLVCVDGPQEWPGTQLAFRVEQARDGDGSVVRFWHGGWEYEDGVLPRASFEWAMRLDALRRHIEGAPPA